MPKGHLWCPDTPTSMSEFMFVCLFACFNLLISPEWCLVPESLPCLRFLQSQHTRKHQRMASSIATVGCGSAGVRPKVYPQVVLPTSAASLKHQNHSVFGVGNTSLQAVSSVTSLTYHDVGGINVVCAFPTQGRNANP